MRAIVLTFLLAATAYCQVGDAAYEPLEKAFESLRLHDYDTAIESFRKASFVSPKRPDIRKNLAYTLLKIGDTDSARDEFGEAMRIDPADFHVALEYAFLCFEARDNPNARKAEARRIFASVRGTGDAESRVTAATAFRNIDEPLRAGIDRWQLALATSVPSFSAYYELAQLAEQRDDHELAATSYKAAFWLQPERKSVLLDLARVEKAYGNAEGVMAALIAASRGPEPRAAELAREQLPARYPFVYEFRQALELDPANQALHRELAYLLLEMSKSGKVSREEAQQELSALAPPPDRDLRALGERSYKAGFLKDALRYFMAAREDNPLDSALALKLGWTNNLLHDDATALKWFDIARQSDDPAIAAEAKRAWRNLRPPPRFRTTVWMYPLFSSRWGDVFGYGQLKTEFRMNKLPVHPYVSLRLAGDVRRTTSGPLPQSLSESAFITGLGIGTDTWHGATAWFEAGIAFSYLNGNRWSDYRGGISYSKTRGAALRSESSGWFLETNGDSVYISHFDEDLINYAQGRLGYTTSLAASRVQFFWNQNFTFDVKKQYWANFMETGPGFRIHPPGLPPPLWINLSAIHGVYLRNEGNPGRPNFNDFRVGIWYAFTK